MRIARFAVIFLVAPVLGFALGLAVAPERVRTVEIESTRARAESAALNLTTTDTKTIERWRTKIITRPDGTREETREAHRGNENHAAAVKVVTKIETQERLVYRDRETVRARYNWSLGASAGYGLDLRPRYQAEVARRLVGGLWLTVGVDVSGRAALAGLRMEF